MRRLLVLLLGLLLATVPTASALDEHVAQSGESTTTADAPNIADEPLPDDEKGGSTWLLVVMAIIVAVMVVVAAAFVRGRRPPE